MAVEELRLCRLTAQNVLRLKCVDIEFEGTGAVVIGGRNAQGKSSALNAIWYALGGKKMHAKRPIHDGEDEGLVRLDLGKYIVERRWTDGGEKTELRLTGADGGVFKRAQELLDTFFEDVSVDPLEFIRRDGKSQAQIVLATLPVDIAGLDAEREQVYLERRDLNRELDQRKGALARMPSVADAPAAEVSLGQLAAELSAAELKNRQNDAVRAAARLANERVTAAEASMDAAWEAYAAAEAEFVLAREAAAGAERTAAATTDTDTAELRAALMEAEATNERFRAASRNRELRSEIDFLSTRSQAMTDRLRAIDEEKSAAIAEADLGIEGLGFEGGELTFNGLPLAQASSAEQLRVSLAISLRLNPKLRLVTISDGSLLDDESLQIVRDMAEASEAVVLIERVGAGPEVQVVIEDGEVAEVRR